jgi:hypothetical protein
MDTTVDVDVEWIEAPRIMKRQDRSACCLGFIPHGMNS